MVFDDRESFLGTKKDGDDGDVLEAFTDRLSFDEICIVELARMIQDITNIDDGHFVSDLATEENLPIPDCLYREDENSLLCWNDI